MVERVKSVNKEDKIVAVEKEHLFYEKLLTQYRERVMSCIPYRVNLVDILGANENAHTRILTAILNYDRDGQYPFVKSFVSHFLTGIDNVEVNSPRIAMQRNYIDALIWEENKYAIVIENKINWVVDQKEQIKRYIDAVRNLCNVNPEDGACIVIYLTEDGRKKVERFSFTEDAKKLLGYKDNDNPGRYIELNYKEDILPWLKEDVLLNCRYGEHSLVTMLEQYIDYLENRFGGRKKEYSVLFEKFLKRECDPTNDLYGQLKNWSIYCAKTDFKDENKYVVADFGAQVQAEMARLVRLKYDKDFYDAAVSKGESIRKWAKENGFNPRKWYNSTFFEFHVKPFNQRIKFQIDVDDGSNKIFVQFFNNDFLEDAGRHTLEDFADLNRVFRECFPIINDINEWKVSSLVGEVNSEESLLVLLNNSIKKFLGFFYMYFKGEK